VDLVDTTKIGRNERVAQLGAEMPNAYFASAYDDDFVIAGNASLGEEIAARDFDLIVSPVGGGGLVSGIVKGLGEGRNGTRVYGAEPLLGNDAARSLRQGSLVANETEPMTIADGARTISLGRRNWAIIKDSVTEIIEVPDELIKDAVNLFFALANLKTEPTGALGLGAVLQRPELFSDAKVCVIVSGGNVDPEVYKSILN
jgi:threonine dehydratase